MDSLEPDLGLSAGFAQHLATAATMEQRIRRLLQGTPYAVLCTQGNGHPYGSLIAFAPTPDLTQMVFSTPVTTRKYRLLTQCTRVALLIDDRAAGHADLMEIEAVTATGKATRIVEADEFDRWAHLLLERHPHFESFVRSPTSALFRVDVVRYFHVTRIQEVTEWRPTP